MNEKKTEHISNIEKDQKKLEELVHERTSELESVNKQLMKEIKEHQHTYSELNQILNTSFPICVINKEHEFILINDAYASFFHTTECVERDKAVVAGASDSLVWIRS